ncbi:MFS transporter [Salsipaludibacter albus]|uniref:MFS transporter n=1 Tax=Salsipaludibacter albus TaxID=2849650 RepID=UPI001EE4A535|nr:MFS transporter [Salsipaludibacter albus]MBY5161314.1 MFS transporter [Salsipaludibacter albus]
MGRVDLQVTPSVTSGRREVVAGSVGNLVEWYEFALFGAFATPIAATFFPEADAARSLLTVFGVFGLAFVMRPFGALLFGHLGDRVGRRHVLVATLGLMAVATAGIGLVPSHARVGVVAPVLVIVLRSVQGVAIGGEFGGSASLVVEGVEPRHRGWYGGWHWATTGAGLAIGIAAGALVGMIPASSPAAAWAWRVPFLVALPLGVVGLVVRTRVDDSAAFRDLRATGRLARRPLRDALEQSRPQLAVGFTTVAAAAVTFNLFSVFLPNHLVLHGWMDLPTALGVAFVTPLLGSATAPWFGRLSDRVGRRVVVLAGLVGLVAAIPLGLWLATSGSLAWTLFGFAVVGVPLGCLSLTAFLAELFPTPVRHSGISLSYGLATAILGGTAPVVASVLSGQDGGLVLPGLYGLATVGVAVVVVWRVSSGPGDSTDRLRT